MFLPISIEDLTNRNIKKLDFICITGDAYVDHPAFGNAIISRLIESLGFSVGVISQPANSADIAALGQPKYAFMVTSGNIDSMVAHYTAALKKRSDDAYTAGGKAGSRPDRAVIVYSNYCKTVYPDTPVILGGLEASLRRFAHYDYWDDKVRPSILIDSKADLLVYGMGEHQTAEIVTRLSKGENIKNLTDIRGTAFLTTPQNTPYGCAECPSFTAVTDDKKMYAKAVKIQYDYQDEIYGKGIIQRHNDKMLVQNPPALSLTSDELDRIYALPFERTYHPVYEKDGGVDAIKEVEFSITHNRGCFGNCNFCSITLHQGRKITARSEESILNEAKLLTENKNFKGYIHDVGGPTANFRQPSCEKQLKAGLCKGKKCLAPHPCEALIADHTEYLHILRKLREIPGIKKVFIRSGIRYDYLLEDKNDDFFRELVKFHVSGQLKVAPEHCSAAVLDKMGKPHIESYIKFSEKFFRLTGAAHKEQYLVPYLMSSHPGSTLADALELALFLKKRGLRPEQVQDFYPTPGTISTTMFYTGLDPYTNEPVYIPKSAEEKAMQRAMLQYFKPQNQALVIKALIKLRRTDLIGNTPECLVKPDAEFIKIRNQRKAENAQKRGKQWQQEKHRTNNRRELQNRPKNR
ncbi:MAG: YgiQ family radical SAM protein [Ruminococcus sp.]|jgi:uncharacterized radical SAM protein YgiQ|nr:YgiQ family radical SAM protein [Ruminococcus sp.]